MWWTDTPEKSVLTFHAGTMRYHAIVKPDKKEGFWHGGYDWRLYRLTDYGWDADLEHAKLEAARALVTLIESDKTKGDAK